jgi:type I restriction enzyme S subunit
VFFIQEDYWPLNTTLWVKDFKGNDPRFAYYLLQTLDFHSCSDKSSVPGVNRNDLHRIPISVPLLDEQVAIARILGSVDDKIELNRRMNETLEASTQALFKSWFVDFDPVRAKADGKIPLGLNPATGALFPDKFHIANVGQIPKGWDVASFASTVRIIGGGTPKTSVPHYWNGEIPWFSVADAPRHSDVYVVNTEKKITQAGVENSSTQVLSEGTTIISARGTVGKVALVGVPMAMNQSCYALVGKNSKRGFFTYLATRALVSILQQRAPNFTTAHVPIILYSISSRK